MMRKAPTRHKVLASPDPLTGRILPRARAGSSERYPFVMCQSSASYVRMGLPFFLDMPGYAPDITELPYQRSKEHGYVHVTNAPTLQAVPNRPHESDGIHR